MTKDKVLHTNEVLSQLLRDHYGQSNTLTIPVPLMRLCENDPAVTIFLNQCIYWSDRGSRKDKFFWKSLVEWEHETGLKRRTIERAREFCTSRGYLEIKKFMANGAPTLHYYCNWDKVYDDLQEMMRRDLEEKNRKQIEEVERQLEELRNKEIEMAPLE